LAGNWPALRIAKHEAKLLEDTHDDWRVGEMVGESSRPTVKGVEVRDRDRGQSVVEFALILPVLLLILLGTIDFGRLYYSYVTVANAARVGAEYGMDYWRANPTSVKDMVKAEARPYITIGDSDITVTASPSWYAGSQLNVEVRTGFSAFTPLISQMWGGGPLTLRADATTRFTSR